jgi:cell division protein FtsX
MDSQMIAVITVAVGAVGGIFAYIFNHKHLRSHMKSNCCGKEVNAEIEIDTSTPTKEEKIIDKK